LKLLANQLPDSDLNWKTALMSESHAPIRLEMLLEAKKVSALTPQPLEWRALTKFPRKPGEMAYLLE
jgi:hypothetical protein